MKVLLGGISMPAGEAAALTAAANAGRSPPCCMRGESTVPTAAAEATDAPETEPNIAFATTVVWASEAGSRPATTWREVDQPRLAMPPLFMRPPARMKNGMASRANELLAAKMPLCGGEGGALPAEEDDDGDGRRNGHGDRDGDAEGDDEGDASEEDDAGDEGDGVHGGVRLPLVGLVESPARASSDAGQDADEVADREERRPAHRRSAGRGTPDRR